MKSLNILVVAYFIFNFANGHLLLDLDLQNVSYKSHLQNFDWSADDEPLILTPYLKEGKINEARNAAFVAPLAGNIQSYAGFFTVDQKYDSNMYFWYFPAETAPESAPVVLWMQGGPGGSSLYGLFLENGPYNVNKNDSIGLRDVYWSKTMHVLYIDNPVGTGFSFTNDQAGYSTDEATVGKNLYSTMQQFFTLFPELRKNEFFITGESYAGKYVPALGYAIHQNNPFSENKINLKGLAIGDGLSDPVNQLGYGSCLKGIGLIDDKQKELFEELENQTIDLINGNGNEVEAFLSYSSLVGGKGSLFYNTTGYEYVYNYLISYNLPFDSSYVSFITKQSIRKAIHVGNLPYEMISKDVYIKLIPDFTRSVAPWISILADNYRLLMYNGELDIVVAYSLTANYLNKLTWCGAEEFANARRIQYRVGGMLAGYIKTSAPSYCGGSISFAMVRKAGHTVPQDQPLWAYHLISDFTNNLI